MPKSNSVTSTSNAVKSNKQNNNNHLNADNQDSTSSGNSLGSTHSHVLSKYQGQKWQQIFDVEKVLKHIRMAEKTHIKGKGGGASGNEISHKSFNSSNNSPPNKSRKNQIRQVQRLNGTDMHYYGIVPKQTAVDVVVCSVCMGIYTKVGFNNHMMLQHPSVWTSVSAKVTTPVNDTPLGTNDSSQDSLKGSESAAIDAPVTGQREVMGSPSDFSGTMSTCSNASSSSMSTVSSSATQSVNYVTPLTTTSTSSRQKSSSKGGSSGSSRSRSKSKHHSSSTTASSSVSSNANAEVSHSSSTASGSTSAGPTSSKKSSSKKSSSSSSSSNANSSSAATTTTTSNGNGVTANNSNNTSSNTSLIVKETAETKLIIGGTSSSASTTITTTAVTASSNMVMPSTVTVTTTAATTNSINSVLEVSHTTNTSTTTTNANLFGSSSSSSSSSSSFSSSSSSSSSSSNSSYSLPPTPKMVVNNTPQDTQQIANINSIVESAFSQGVLDNKEKLSLTSNGECLTSRKKKIKSPSAPFCLPDNVDAIKTEATAMPPLRIVIQQQPLNQYDDQISELDQAVSSITGGDSSGGSVSGNENKLDSTSNVLKVNTQSSMGVKIEQSNCGILNGTQQDIQQQQHQQHQLHTEGGQLVNNASDDSAMLNHVLDVMLDSKLINEILNAETELNFDENVLNDSSSTVNQHNTNQHQQQQAVYLDQPLTKRMRFDESTNMGRLQQQLTSGNHEISGEFTVFPQEAQAQQQQQQHQPQAQFAQYDVNPMTSTLSMDGHYQTPIDAMQLQQLIYQQQQSIDSSAYVGGNLGLANHHQQHQQPQHQQIYDPNGATIVDTKQILELCGGAVGVQQNGNELIKAEEFATLPEDVSHQFQIFNVPSLTDDIETEPQTQQQQITHHIVERQYVMPGNEETEEQLIYEITTNNSMSQQHQQQVLAEFLNQAASTYEQQQHQQLQQQVSHHLQQQQQQQQHFVADNTNKLDNFYDELLDFDYSIIETVKSLTSSSSSSSSNSNSTSHTNALVKSERDHSLNSSSSSSTSSSTFKYNEDFYFNVFFYAGIPRPLAINCFGLIKLPQGVATTFRKHLLTTRKANNSLMSLGGSSLNGVVGQSSSVAAAGAVGSRFSNSKQLPSYFTNLANNGGNSNSNMGNEFSIGSITITNAPSSNVQQQGGNNGAQQQQQNKQNNSSGTTNPLEVNLNSINGGISATSPVSALSRGRTKSGGSNHSSGSYNSTISNNLKHKSVGSLGNTASAARVTVGTIGPYNAKTIFVSSTAALNAERNKFIKRSLIARVHQDPTRASAQGQQQFTSKKLSDILSGKKPCGSANNSDIGNSSLSGLEITSEMAAEKQAKLSRVNRFYERRRKLLNITQQQQQKTHRHAPYQSSQVLRRQQLVEQQYQPQQQQKLLKQQLMRSFSDCGINSTSNTSSVPSADSNVMRVFV